jgi:predicted transcriptional regulator
MPSKSQKQHNLMAMVANNPVAAKRLGISQSVGKEFVKADKGRKFNEGGDMKESKAMMKKEVSFMKAKGAPKSMVKHEQAEVKGMKAGGFTRSADGIAKKGKTKAKQIVMKSGGKC